MGLWDQMASAFSGGENDLSSQQQGGTQKNMLDVDDSMDESHQ